MNGLARRAGLALTAASFVLVVVGLHRVMLVGTCGDVGEKVCPPEVMPYAWTFVAGLLLGCVALFALGTGEAFGALFAGIGVAALWAGSHPADEGGQRWYLAFGLFFLLCGLGLLNLRRNRDG